MRDLDDVFDALAKSSFRRRFRLRAQEAEYLRSRGLETVMEHGAGFIAKRLAPAVPPNDGKQTPMRGHPVFLAQHATGTCCRGCLAKWHGIPRGVELSAEQRDHVLATIRRWITTQAAAAPDSPTTARPVAEQGDLGIG